MENRAAGKGPITVILLLFVLLGAAGSVINPLHEATDELRHYRFVRYLSVEHSLPVQGQLGCSAQGHHPPLFYLFGAAATSWIDTGRDVCYAPQTNPFWGYRYWEVGDDNKNQYLHGADESFPWQGEALAAHIVRALNVFLGAGVVYITWLIGRAIWPEQPSLALGGAAFVAFNPMFIYMAGAINNDVIAALSGSAVTLASIRLLKDDEGLSRRWGVILGLLFGIALMSKFNLAAIALLIEATVTWVAWRKKQWQMWWQVNLLISLATLLIAGWWFVRNQLLYGEPTGFQRLTELWGVRDPLDSWGVAIFELPYAWTSLWGRFGYGQIPLPQIIYDGLHWTALVALAGLPVSLLPKRGRTFPALNAPLFFLILNVALFFSVLFSYLLVSPAGPMGRFFFPALPSLGLLMFYGLHQWLRLLSGKPAGGLVAPRRSLLLALFANLAMFILAATALFGYLAPAYARPVTFAEDADIPNLIDAQFDSLVKLRGYDFPAKSVQPGESINLDLYWQVTGKPPGDYLLFVHLVDETGVMIAQRDTHPGLGSFPSSQWQPGDRFVESVELTVPETAYTNSSAALRIGLYAPNAYRLAISGSDGQGMGDTLELGQVEIVPSASDYPNPLDQNFNNEIRLIGYSYSQRQLELGDTLSLTLYWRALGSVPPDYLVQITLQDESGNMVLQTADRPVSGESPTSSWRSGQLIEDTHELQIDPSLAPASYRIQLALINASTGHAQNIVADDGHWIDDRLPLSSIRVLP